MECGRDVSDKAEKCPGCGAPVIVENAPTAPASVGFEGGEFIGTKAMIVDLAKRAIARVGYRLDAADETAGTVTFTTGMTLGSWSGVSGTIAMQEGEPYHFKAIGQAKQNVRGGQVLALNLFDEANGKVQNVITDMQALVSTPVRFQASGAA